MKGKILIKIILILAALLIGGFAVQTGIYFYKIKTGKLSEADFAKKFTVARNLPAAASANAQGQTAKAEEIVSATAPSYGAANPKLTIVEFGNFDCPNSQAESSVAREIMVKNKGEVRFIYRDFPLDDIYPGSSNLSLAGRCAEEQGKFWAFHDKMYASPASDPLLIAKQAGLDEQKFSSCLSAQKYAKDITQDFLDGYKNGVLGTPTFFFIKAGEKPRIIPGAIPKATFENIVQNFLR